MRFRLPLILAILLSLLPVSPVVSQQGGNDPAPDPRVAKLEVAFMQGMIPHHRSAVAMAEMAVMKASRPELREAAQRMIDEQQVEIDQMTAYLRDWYGVEPPEGTAMPQEAMAGFDMPVLMGLVPPMEERMMALESKTGADFDVEFMSAMAEHHSQAVIMAGAVLAAGHHEDLYTLAENVVISQGLEIRQMDEWLDQWYGVKRPL